MTTKPINHAVDETWAGTCLRYLRTLYVRDLDEQSTYRIKAQRADADDSSTRAQRRQLWDRSDLAGRGVDEMRTACGMLENDAQDRAVRR